MIQRILLWALLFVSAPGWGAEEGKAAPAARALAEPVSSGQYAQVFLGLVLILLLIGGLAWVMRRVGNLPFSGSGAIRMQAGLSLGQRERVVLIQVGKTQLLLGVAPGRVQTLHVFDQPVELDSQSGSGERFAEKLAAALKRGGAGQ